MVWCIVLKIHFKLNRCCSKKGILFAIHSLVTHVKESHERILVVKFLQVISKSARKAPETVMSSMGQSVEEDPDTVR